MSRSGQEIGRENIRVFRAWLRERHQNGDWRDYIRGGQLNRTEICSELGFARTVFRQNPTVKKLLRRVERLLRANGILSPRSGTGVTENASEGASEALATLAVEQRIVVANVQADRRIKSLEETNAAQRAEIRDLREQLKRYQLLDDHLGKTGRLLRP